MLGASTAEDVMSKHELLALFAGHKEEMAEVSRAVMVEREALEKYKQEQQKAETARGDALHKYKQEVAGELSQLTAVKAEKKVLEQYNEEAKLKNEQLNSRITELEESLRTSIHHNLLVGVHLVLFAARI